MSTGTFDLWQQTFTLSLMANGDSNFSELGRNPSQLQEYLASNIAGKLSNTSLQGLIGSGWTIGWGPCVYQAPLLQDPLGVADNAMWVARNLETDTFVVAVAATNFLSSLDWLKEDGYVKPEVSWPYGGSVPSGAEISPGTQSGVDILLNMQAKLSAGLASIPLAEYLSTVQSSSATLIFTGHSLGGALAPTLATALFAGSQNGLSIDAWKSVSVYPTAGPTPGNQAFNQLFSQLFPQQSPGSSPWQVWNSLVWNSLDIVPHAWNLTTLGEIADLYLPLYPTANHLTGDLLALAEKNAKGTDYVQLPSNGPLQGTLLSVKGQDNLEQFLNEFLYQHILAYVYLLQVQDLLNLRDASGNPLFNPPDPAAG